MKKRNIAFLGLVVFLILAFISVNSQAADVDVNAQGVYTDDDFEVCVYADINDKPLISFGVLVGYDDSILNVTSAEKNEDDWYFGDGTNNHPYMDPETDIPGDVVIIGGKLDETDPTAGVEGAGVALGKVRFAHSESLPLSTTVSLGYGRGDGTGDYKNFVANDGEVKDGAGVSFAAVPLYERGDANKDGVFTNSDMFVVRGLINNNEYSCVADCNDDGVMTNSDMFCIRGKL